MRKLTLAQAERKFPDAIKRLKVDRSFIPEDEPLTDEWDIFVLVNDEDLVFANTLDCLADVWDPVDDCWMEYIDSDEAFFKLLEQL